MALRIEDDRFRVAAPDYHEKAYHFSMKLPPELILILYELLPVDNNLQLQVKYQLLVNINATSYYGENLMFELLGSTNFEACFFQNRLCYYQPGSSIPNQLVTLGQLDPLKYLWNERYIDISTDSLFATLAAIYGHLHILNWLKEQGALIDLGYNFSLISQLEVLKWMHENNYKGWSEADMDLAAVIGNLDVIVWLHENRTEGCTTNAMNNAAAGGYLEIVQWLHENRTEGCTEQIMNLAVKGFHVDVVKWIKEYKNEFFNLDVIRDCLRNETPPEDAEIYFKQLVREADALGE